VLLDYSRLLGLECKESKSVLKQGCELKLDGLDVEFVCRQQLLQPLHFGVGQGDGLPGLGYVPIGDV